MHGLNIQQLLLPWIAPESVHAAALARPVGDLGLPTRTAKPLHRLGIMTIGDLCKVTEATLMIQNNIGPLTLEMIKQSLLILGLDLRQRKIAAR